MLTLLRGWIGLVAAMALVSVIQSSLDQQFVKDRVYNLQPSEATKLTSRIFCVWMLLAAVVRIAYVISPYNKSLFAATLVSFVVVFFHFTLEVFVYHTASPSFASITPLIVSGGSILWMTFVWPTISLNKTSKKIT